MADALVKTTYQEDPDMLAWIDGIAAKVSDHRGGAKVSRADVIRWLTRRARREVSLAGLPTNAIAAQI